MKLEFFSEDLKKIILNKAGSQSRKYYQTFVGIPHIFLAMFSSLAEQKDTPRYSNIYKTLREILNEYNINGAIFEKKFLETFPRGTAPEAGENFNIVVDREFNILSDTLKRRAIAERRSMEIEDLILEMFTDRSFSIFTLFSDIIGNNNKTDEMYDKVLKAFKKASIQEIKDLEEMPELTNLNKWIANNNQTVVGAEEILKKIEMGLSGKSIRNVILTGPAGVGKTCYVHEFVRQILAGNVPDVFKDKIIYQLDSGALVAGTRYRGDMEEKIVNILSIVKEHPEVILFIDELHTFLEAGGGSDGGSQSAGNLIKPYITRGELQIIGCTTNEEYTKFVKKDKAFERRFHEVKIEEPSLKETEEILRGILPEETEFFNKAIQEELVAKIVELSAKYTLDQANPAKSINMLELACAYSKIFEDNNEAVDINAVIESVRLKFNYFISDNKLETAEKALKDELFGQDEALDKALKDLEIVEAGVTDITRPLCSMLLYGPTGVGKTQFCKTLAKSYFGSENCLVKIDMGSYANEADISKLTGSSPGYIGYNDEPEIIKQVRQHPNSVVLFDEIEKAHKNVLKALLSILDEGELTDNKGDKVSFRNCIVVFTTNLGCTHNDGKAKGIGLIKSGTVGDADDKMKAIKDFFSPEFLGRLDDMIFFQPLHRDIIGKIIDKYLKEYQSRSESDFIKNCVLTEDDINAIIEKSNIETQGARGVRKALQRYLADLYFKNKRSLENA